MSEGGGSGEGSESLVNGLESCKLEESKGEERVSREDAQAGRASRDGSQAGRDSSQSGRDGSQAEDSQASGDSAQPDEEQAAAKSALNKAFSEQFKAFSKFGDTKSDGRFLSLSQSDKWMKQAKVIDAKTITTTDTGIHFKKLKSLKVNENDYKKFLADLAKTKKMNVDDIKQKLVSCGLPGLTSTVAGSKATSAVERLTDPSRYTGSHKQRFDQTGKGRGIAGRKDIVDNSGYVSGYQNKNTYDRTHST